MQFSLSLVEGASSRIVVRPCGRRIFYGYIAIDPRKGLLPIRSLDANESKACCRYDNSFGSGDRFSLARKYKQVGLLHRTENFE
jgi:hypothetical protein